MDVCLSPGTGWEEGGGEGFRSQVQRRSTLHRCPTMGRWRTPLPAVSSAADAESHDPDSTNNLESEAPRDYFLKCKWPPRLSPLALPRLLG